MNNFYVYVYFEKDIPIYVGKGKGYRLYKHLTACLRETTNFYNYLRRMVLDNEFPTIQKVSEDLTEEEAYCLEKELIYEYGRKDLGTGTLFNESEGGQGGWDTNWTEERRKLHSRRMLGHVGNTGYKHTEETKEKMRQAHRTVEAQIRMRLQRRGKIQSLETVNKRQETKIQNGTNLKTQEQIKEITELFRETKGHKIESFNLETGETIKQYPSIGSIKEDGFSPSTVHRILTQTPKSNRYFLRKSHNRGWRYS